MRRRTDDISLYSPRQSSSMNNKEFLAAIAIAVLFLVRMLGLFTILPVLPLVAEELVSSTPLLIGVAIGIYGLSQAVLQVPLGLASDRFSRKSVITFGLVIFILGSLVAAMAEDIFGIILGRFLQGCGAIASTLLALVSDVTRVEQRSKAMAIIGAGIGTSFGVSIVLGPVIAAYAGLSGVFMFSAMVGVLGLIILWTVVPTPISLKTNLDTKVVMEKFSSVLFNSSLIPVNLGVFFLHYFLTAGFLVFPLLFREVGISDADHSMYYLGILFASVVLMAPFVWVSDRKGRSRSVMQWMVMVLLLAMLGLASVKGSVALVLFMVAFFIGFNLLEVLLPAHMSRVVAAGTRGTGMGVYSTFQFLGTFAGGVVGGVLLSYGDISTVLYVNSGVCVFWFLLSFKVENLNEVESRTIDLRSDVGLPANQVVEGLLSVNGVLDVVLIEEERVAYLKVDSDRFNETDIQQFTQ